MNLQSVRSTRSLIVMSVFLAWITVSFCAWGQDRPPKPKRLAPGVVTIVPPLSEENETYSGPRPIVEIVEGMEGLEWSPKHSPDTLTLKEMAGEAIFRREVWYLEFSFKPLRMMTIDVPQPNGKMQRKLIWYLIFKVRNNGYHAQPAPEPDKFGHETYSVTRVNHTIRFFPHVVLQTQELKKAYLDRIIPSAVRAIQQREDPAIRLLNTVQISRIAIPVSTPEEDKTVWGVATWEDVDPRADFVSVYIQGLTNAYRWDDPEGAFGAGDAPGTGRTYERKTLQLNFWRPGDEVRQNEAEVRYGFPLHSNRPERELLQLYQVERPVDYLWRYQ